MTEESLDKINGRNSFFYVFVIFVPVVVKGNRMTVIMIYSGCCNNRAAKITTDIFDNGFGVTKIRFGINVESLFMIAVTFGFNLFKRRSNDGFHFIQECGAESIAKIGIVKIFDLTPETVITKTAFREEAVDMRIPFEVSAEGMQNHNEPGSEVSGFIQLIKHTGNNTVNCMKKTVEQRTVKNKKLPEIFVNGKNTMAVPYIDQFKRHTGRAFHRVFVTTGRAKAAVAAKRNEFKLSAMGAGIHGTTKRGIATVNHFINIFHLSISWMKSIFNFFIIVSENFL